MLANTKTSTIILLAGLGTVIRFWKVLLALVVLALAVKFW